MKELVGFLVVAALLAASCSSGSSAEPPATTSSGTAPSTALAPTTTSAGPATELTASFRGVTADSILVGYTAIDFDNLNETFGLELTYANFGPAAEAFVADINERGGIHGRQIELRLVQYLPVGATTADAACIELTEDVEVFAVLNGFAGAGADSVNECIADLHDTILVGATPRAGRTADDGATWVTPDIAQDRRARGFVEVLKAEGELDGLGPIGVIATDPDLLATGETFAEALDQEGGEVAFVGGPNSADDETATRAEVDVLLERARLDGAGTILMIGQNPWVADQIMAAGDEFTVMVLEGERATTWRTAPPAGIENAKRILTSINETDVTNSGIQRCFAIGGEAFGVTLGDPVDLAEGETDYFAAVQNTCQQFAIFEALATAAGADLTNESFAEAVENGDDISLDMIPLGSFGPGKFDFRDSLGLGEWSEEANRFVVISDTIEVEY